MTGLQSLTGLALLRDNLPQSEALYTNTPPEKLGLGCMLDNLRHVNCFHADVIAMTGLHTSAWFSPSN